MSSAALILACLAASAVSAVEVEVTPVQKILQLLTGMVEKGKQEKNDEAVQFSAYRMFCKTTTEGKQQAISDANDKISVLQADIAKYETDAQTLAEEIRSHDEDIATWENDLKTATEVRNIENIDYIATHKDYDESISALHDGIEVLKAEQHDVEQSASLLQQISRSPLIPPETKRILEVFLSQDPDDENLAVAAPEAHAYENQSGGLVDMLVKLVSKFEDERTEMEKQEVNAIHAFEMLQQDLKAQVERGNEDRTAKSEQKAEALQQASDSKGDLTDTSTTRDDDAKYLSELSATCATKDADFESRQVLRQDEIVAVEKAIEILSSGAVAGSADKHLPALAQVKANALAQLRSGKEQPVQLRIAAFLKSRATKFGSRVLSAIATKVSGDPFKKVKKMLKDLIVKLMEEANEEATHKGWCDTELTTNEQTRKEKLEGVEMLTAGIDELDASIAKLSEEVAELTKAVADLDAAVAKATAVREGEKEKNKQTIADAQAAQTAVAQAMSVLQEFYAKAGQATALVQKQENGQKQEPEVFDTPYKGMGAENGGVMGMIEVIASDFARLETETTAAETEALAEYNAFMTDSSVDKGQKTTDIDHKTSKKQNHVQALQEHKTDLEQTQKELDAAMGYYEKLKPSCIDSGETYEDRVQRRKEEIESLQQALQILNGEDV